MFVLLQWEHRWVFLQLWPIYVPGFDMKWKLFCKYSTPYCEWIINVFFLCLFVCLIKMSIFWDRRWQTSLCWCMPDIQSTSDGKNPVFFFFKNLLHRIKDLSVLLFHCNFKTNRFPLCLFVIWRLRSSSLLFVTFQMPFYSEMFQQHNANKHNT